MVCACAGVGEQAAAPWSSSEGAARGRCTDDLCGALDFCSEAEIRSIADAIVAEGLDKLGYEYVNMDDCWSATTRNASGFLQPNPDLFPSGMRNLSDYVHARGLKLGLYTCVGTETCRRHRPGSFGYWQQDAAVRSFLFRDAPFLAHSPRSRRCSRSGESTLSRPTSVTARAAQRPRSCTATLARRSTRRVGPSSFRSATGARTMSKSGALSSDKCFASRWISTHRLLSVAVALFRRLRVSQPPVLALSTQGGGRGVWPGRGGHYQLCWHSEPIQVLAPVRLDGPRLSDDALSGDDHCRRLAQRSRLARFVSRPSASRASSELLARSSASGLCGLRRSS